MIRSNEGDGRGLVGHAQRGRTAINREFVGRERAAEIVGRPVVLRDDGAARLDPREEPRQIGDEILALVERTHADHHGIKAAEFFRREIIASELAHGVAELREIFRDAVTGAGQITDGFAANREVERRDLEPRRRLQQLHGQMRVVELDAPSAVARPADFSAGTQRARRRLRGRRDSENERHLVAGLREFEGMRGWGNFPAGRRLEFECAVRARTRSGDFDDGRLGDARREQLDLIGKTERHGRNHRERSALLRLGCASDNLHGLVGDDESLPTDFENELHGKRGRIHGLADEFCLIDAEQSRRAFLAQPVRLRNGRARGKHDGGGLVHRLPGDERRRHVLARLRRGIAHVDPAHGHARAHCGRVAERECLAGHGLGAGESRFHRESEARLQNAIKLGALVGHDRIGREHRELRTNRKERGHAGGRIGNFEFHDRGVSEFCDLCTTGETAEGEIEAVRDVVLRGVASDDRKR